MIRAVFYKKNNRFYGFELNGHANYADFGKDIVCSAVSAVAVGGINAILNIDDFDVKIENGDVYCVNKSVLCEHDSVVIDIIFIQLKTIQDKYEKNLTIEERME